MAIKGFEWVGADKMAHTIIAIMISGLLYFWTNIDVSIIMLIVTAVGFGKEYFDKNRHKLGLKQGKFDKYDVIATMTGGAIFQTIVGIYEFFNLIF